MWQQKYIKVSFRKHQVIFVADLKSACLAKIVGERLLNIQVGRRNEVI
jgi:hypothetical protein